MKTARMTLLLGAALVIAAGCSTAPVADNQPAYELDYKRMALIEAVAHTRGVRVIWVNAPRHLAN